MDNVFFAHITWAAALVGMHTSHFNQQNLPVCGQDDSADEIFVDLLECGMSPTQLLDSFVYPAHLDVFAILVRLTFIKAIG